MFAARMSVSFMNGHYEMNTVCVCVPCSVNKDALLDETCVCVCV